MKKFKKGDWVFHDMELAQVDKVEDGKVVSVTTGIINTGGRYLICFPLEMKYKVASGAAYYWYKKFHEINSLNHADVCRKLESLWVELCRNIDDEVLAERGYKAIDQFGREVLEMADDFRSKSLNGINIFR